MKSIRASIARLSSRLPWNVLAHELRLIRAATVFQSLPESVLTFHYDDQPIRFYVPDGLTDFNQRRLILLSTFQEEPWLAFLRRRINLVGGTVVDVGANLGNHTVYFAAVCGVAKCISFEPSERARALLARNIELNGLTKVELHPYGLGESDGVLEMRGVRANHMGSKSYQTSRTGTVPCRTLDGLGLSQVDLVKIDVEGMSPLVLKGARDTLSASRAPVFVEMHREEREEATSVLLELGYQLTHQFDRQNFLFERRI